MVASKESHGLLLLPPVSSTVKCISKVHTDVTLVQQVNHSAVNNTLHIIDGDDGKTSETLSGGLLNDTSRKFLPSRTSATIA